MDAPLTFEKSLHAYALPSVSQHLDTLFTSSYTFSLMSDVSADATLNLSSLISRDPSQYEVSGEGLLEPSEELLELDGLRLAEPIDWELEVRSTGGDDDFVLTGSAAGVAVMECRRCLDEVEVESVSNLVYPMVYRPGTEGLVLLENDDDEEDVLVFGKPEVDFASLITQVFAIDLPLTALCRDDCKGLSSDGVNLNEHPEHEAPKEETDAPSPFAVLKDLEV